MEKEKEELIHACIELLIITRQDIPSTHADNIVHIVEDILSISMKLN